MAIHTSANTYSRGVPKNYSNFFFVAQTNNAVVSPLNIYLRNYQFYNRNYSNTNVYRMFPWNS